VSVVVCVCVCVCVCVRARVRARARARVRVLVLFPVWKQTCQDTQSDEKSGTGETNARETYRMGSDGGGPWFS
jgi:hypothetical protein